MDWLLTFINRLLVLLRSNLIIVIPVIIILILARIVELYEKKKKKDTPEENKDDCFVATVCYGTPLHEDLDVLRGFRNNTLKKNWLGQRFVDWYYENGPAMAKWVARSETRKSLVRNFLIKPVVFILKK